MRGVASNRMRWTVGAVALLALAFASVALAAAPTATTGPATVVGSTSATVGGSVDPHGQATTWWVEYGTSTSYGSKTAAANAGAGPAAVSVSVNVAGLKAGTTYHYRVVANNAAGTSRGGDAVFTTLVPPDVTTGAASSISASSATLNGTVDANGRSTTYYFDYGTSTSYGSKSGSKSAGSATSAQAAATGISGLVAGRTYHFRIVATSDAGTAVGKDATFTTSSAPTVVTGDASSIAPTTATLHGTVTPNGLSTTWWFEYGTSTGYGTKTPSHGAGSGTAARGASLGVKSLKAGTTYHFRLVAQNSRGTGRRSRPTFSTVGAPLAQTGAAAERRPRHRGRHRNARDERACDDLVVRVRHVDGLRQVDAAKNAGSTSASQQVSAQVTGSCRRRTITIGSSRRATRERRAEQTLHSRRSASRSAPSCIRRLRRPRPALRRRSDAPGEREGHRLRAAVRGRLAARRRDRPPGRGRSLAVPRAAEDRDDVPGELAEPPEHARHDRRAPARHVHAAQVGPVRLAGARRSLLRRPASSSCSAGTASGG